MMNGKEMTDVTMVVCVADDNRIGKLLTSITDYCNVIVVLNGASEQVKAIVNSFKSSKIFILSTVEIEEKNLSKARNIGTKESKTSKVIHYDSDCLYVPGAIQMYSDYLNHYMLVDGRVEYKHNSFQSEVVAFLRSLGLPNCALCPSIGINKKIIDLVGYYFDEDIKWIEDADLNARARKANVKIGKINTTTCIHDTLSFRQDLKSAYRYGTGAKIAKGKKLYSIEGKTRKNANANWQLLKPCFKRSIFHGLYAIAWNLCYCIGFYCS